MIKTQKMSISPASDCSLCTRLVRFRNENRQKYPTYHNAPVPAFGSLDAELLIVGLAPGLKGANATGRPFTGDYAGDVLYKVLLDNEFATGSYVSPRGEDISGAYEDNLKLQNCRITNAVRCLPPANKPETSEIKTCNSFLTQEIEAMPNLRVIVALGLVSHNAVLKALGLKASFGKFAHGAQHQLNRDILLIDSYHCSRYNINTRRLSPEMFNEIFRLVASRL